MPRSIAAAVAALLVSASSAAAQPTAAGGLRIVVIDGEDAVNIIQQNTAVRPVVEVRDRNDLPVPGVLVTFSIEGGKAASFGGASTMSVVTNAAGQAAVTGLTPSAAGVVQINVQAALQGQIATATITQTNVLTAAQAAAAAGSASGASSAGSAGGAGGAGAGAGAGAGTGLSATTIGIVGGAVAGGAVVATQVARRDEESAAGATFTGSFSGPIVSVSVGGRGETCTVNRTLTMNVSVTLREASSSAVSGKAEFSGTDTVVSSTCSGPGRTDQVSRSFEVTGTPASFGFRDSRSETGSVEGDPGVTRQATTDVAFNATLSGDVINATMTYDERSTLTGGTGGVVNETATGSFPMTLTKR